MKTFSYHLLRIGLGITFLWIGVLIVQNPLAWGGFMQPWARDMLFLSLEHTMLITGIVNIIVGVLLLLNLFVWVGALLGTIQLILVLIGVGFNDVTIRDIAILGAVFALFVDKAPSKFRL